MGIRTCGFDIGLKAKQQVADSAACAAAKAVVDRWNKQLAAGRDMLWAALIAGMPSLNVHCPGTAQT
jgi:hypothetical protein